jgi:hypothetical protein
VVVVLVVMLVVVVMVVEVDDFKIVGVIVLDAVVDIVRVLSIELRSTVDATVTVHELARCRPWVV